MSSVVISGDTSGAITLQAPAVSGSTTLNLPATSGTVLTSATTQAGLPANIAGTGPAFSYYASSSTAMSRSVWVKVGFQTSKFDTTSGMFSSSRFTPTVAGYYQINTGLAFGTSAAVQQDAVAIYKNGNFYEIGTYAVDTGSLGLRITMSSIVYCNGTTDYIEIYAVYNAGPTTQNLTAGSDSTYFNGALIRGA